MTKQTKTEATVVSLAAFRESVRQGSMAQIETYWEGLRRGRIVPDRADMDPRDISDALENTFVLERVSRNIGRFRLAGSHLNDLLGMEVRGMPLTAMILPDSRDAVAEAVAAVCDEPAVVRMTLRSEGSFGRPEMTARLLLLPLRSDLGEITRILGCLVAEGRIGRAPRRFSLVAQSRRTLIGYGQSEPTRGEPTLREVIAPTRLAHRRPTLSVVECGPAAADDGGIPS